MSDVGQGNAIFFSKSVSLNYCCKHKYSLLCQAVYLWEFSSYPKVLKIDKLAVRVCQVSWSADLTRSHEMRL